MSFELPLHNVVTEIPFNKFPKDFTWEKFEDLCQLLAKAQFEIKEIRPFGTRGDNQQGIDIYAFDIKKNKYLTIQCKRVTNYTPQKIVEAVDTFLAGVFRDNSYMFVLACTDDLSKGKRQMELIRQEQRLASLNIEFLKWDFIGINSLLKGYPKIVGDVFSKEYVKAFNGEEAFEQYMQTFKTPLPAPDKINYEIVPNYIGRTVSTIEEYNKIGFYDEKKKESIISFLKNAKAKNKFILLSEGGYGKSAELSNASNYFSNEKRKEFPIKIELRNCVEGEPIEKMLSDVCENWQGVEETNLMLLFDGLDEVSEKEYNEFIKRVNTFYKKHDVCKIIISSRTNHFNTFNGQNLLSGFDILFLNHLSSFDIDKFIGRKIGDNIAEFNLAVHKNGLTNLLFSPFWLIYICDIFNDTFETNTFPKSKSAILSAIIDKHFDKDNEKFAAIGVNINFLKQRLLRLLKLVAFSMTQLAKNNLTIDELQLIVPNEFERKLLRYSSLLDYKNNAFQFVHNLIQEYLTADILKELELNEIKRLIAFKPGYSKIKNKWHNPLSFLISVLSKNSDKLNQTIHWVANVEPEVLINMESDKLSAELRFTITKKIIEKYKRKGVRIPYYYFEDDELGRFSGYTKQLLEYCLRTLRAKSTPIETKIVCVRIIQGFDNFFGRESDVKNVFEDCALNDILWPYLQGQAIKGIASLGSFINVEDTYWLLKNKCKNIGDWNVRNGIYHLIDVLPFQYDFLEFAIEGVIGINASKSITVMGEEKPIEHIFLKSSDPKVVGKLLNFLSSDKGLLKGAYTKRISFDREFLDHLINNAIVSYSQDKNIVNDILTLIESLHYRFVHDKFYVEILRFFTATNTTRQAFSFFYSKAKISGTTNNWIDTQTMLIFASRKDLRKIYSEYEMGFQNKDFIFLCRNLLKEINKERHDWFYLTINKGSDNQFEYAKGDNFNWDKHRANQRLKDQELLLNKVLFFKEIKKIFTISHKKELTKDELVDYKHAYIRNEEKMNNTLIIPLLRDWAELGKVNYNAMVNKYQNEKRWQGYVVNEVVRILSNKIKVNQLLQQYVTEYIMRTIEKANFEEAITDLPDGAVNYKIYSSQLNIFCQNWEIPLSQNQLLDLLYTDYHSVHEFKDAEYKNRPSNYVLRKISNKTIIKDRVLSNIRDKKLAKPVLGSHFYLCQKLKIVESKVYLYKELDQSRFSEHEKIKILDFYLKLGGEITDLSDIFGTYHKIDYWYWELVDKLIEERPNLVFGELKKILNSNSTTDEEKITASQKLLKKGQIEGLEFFCAYVKKNQKSPYDHFFWQSYANIKLPLNESLNMLFDILIIPFSFATEGEDIRHFDRLDEPIYNLIYIIGLQSDDAYQQVIKRYREFMKVNKPKYPLVKNVNYPMTSLENQYYKNKEEKISIKDVIQINTGLGLM